MAKYYGKQHAFFLWLQLNKEYATIRAVTKRINVPIRIIYHLEKDDTPVFEQTHTLTLDVDIEPIEEQAKEENIPIERVIILGTGSQPRIAVHQSADFPPFARDAWSKQVWVGNAPRDLRDVCFLTPCWL